MNFKMYLLKYIYVNFYFLCLSMFVYAPKYIPVAEEISRGCQDALDME